MQLVALGVFVVGACGDSSDSGTPRATASALDQESVAGQMTTAASSSTNTTVVVPSIAEDPDPLLLVPEDLGPTYEQVAADAVVGPCELDIELAPTVHVRSFASNAAQQLIDQQVLVFATPDAAASALARAMSASSCAASEFGDAGGSATSTVIRGADEAFNADFADETGSVGLTVARRAETIVVIETKLHNGDVAAEPVGSVVAAERALERL